MASKYAPIFLVKDQVLRIGGTAYKLTVAPTIYKYNSDDTNWDVDADSAGKVKGMAVIAIGDLHKVNGNSDYSAANAADGTALKGQVIGSQHEEASGAPEGFRDELSSVEFYTQIFKTAVPLMSGSMMATKYRGYANEWSRIYAEHLKAHKMDLENAFLFGYGQYRTADNRTSWGMVPFLESEGGKRYSLKYASDLTGANLDASDSTYDVKTNFNYDGFVSIMDDFMSYESGNSGSKLCLTSRKVINSLLKTGNGNFLDNSMSDNVKDVFNATLDVKGSSFMPIDITSIKTSYGEMNFIAHPLFRDDMADKAVCIDLANVAYRPLAGNGISRDTFVETNVQENDIDGRKDMIITEAGLEVMLPETHAVLDFV